MAIQYSNAPGKLLKEVDEFSGHTLKKSADLQVLFEECITKGKDKLLEELMFTSKYIQGLLRVLKEGNNNPDVKNLDNIKTDLSANMQKAIGQLKEVISTTDGNTQQYFQKTYFELSQLGFMNLNNLLADLEWAKKYFNAFKRQLKN